jgi:hypothetical protein
MVFLEVYPNENDVKRQFVNLMNVTNVICTSSKILIYTNDGFKGKVIKHFETEEERDRTLEKLNTLMGFYELQ